MAEQETAPAENSDLQSLSKKIEEWLMFTLENGYGELMISVRMIKGKTREIILKRGKTAKFHIREEDILKSKK
ncbi:hypothetical protein L0222_14325 [bacterium]|nr:hypothetical protein [bacterium]